MFFLADCNSFYASCEKAFRPDLDGKPVVVLSNNDGCVISMSPEAKALGVVMGIPYFKVRALCQRHGLTVFSSNYALYGDLSRRVMGSLAKFADRMEVYSIDEAFLELPHMTGAEAEQHSLAMTRLIRQWTGIPISVGAGHTKTLAKVANRMAKKNGRRALSLTREHDIDQALDHMPVTDVWGIAGRWGRRLGRLGIVTALDLKKAPIDLVRKQFGVVMERTVRELNGEKCLELEEEPAPKNQIHVSRSFGELVHSLADLEEATATYAARVGEKLRRQHCVASGLYIYVTTNHFRKQDKQYSNGIAIPVLPATNHTGKLIPSALAGLKQLFRKGYLYKKVGVIALDITQTDDALAQGNLFVSRESREKDLHVMKAVDKINTRFGGGSMVFASQGVQNSRSGWKMRREMMSPRYTTQWRDVPVVR